MSDAIETVHDWWRPWRARRLPPSSVTWTGELPDEDAPPWVCLSEPGAPMVLRRYDPTSRTCDSISRHGRWLLESCLIPRRPMMPTEVQHGWDLAVGDVEPGWCIVYAGHELWFPQRVLKVENVDDDLQRVWSLGDTSTRDVWGASTPDGRTVLEWDNGLATGWTHDQMCWPHWDEGPWWPLQSEPLSANIRRFVLDRFGIAVECPSCGSFGKPIIFGLVLDPGPHVAIGGCCITGDDPDYVCECGEGWSVTDQGEIHEPLGLGSWGGVPGIDGMDEGEIHDTGDEDGVPRLNYDIDDMYPYGMESEHFFQDVQGALVDAAGGAWHEDDFDADLYIRYWGQDRYDADLESMVPERDMETDQ